MSDERGSYRPPPDNDWGRYAIVAAVLAGAVLIGYLTWPWHCPSYVCTAPTDGPPPPPHTFQADLAQQSQQRTPLPQDVREWRRAAWQRDDLLAQFKLGNLYAHDTSFQDPVEAMVWYYLALHRPGRDFDIDDADAQDALNSLGQQAADDSRSLYSTLTLDQREEARKRVIYILNCRGANGLIRLGELHRVNSGGHGDHHDSHNGDSGGDSSSRHHDEEPMEVITPDDGDALMFFEMARLAGHPLAEAYVASQKDIIANEPNGDAIIASAISRAHNWLPDFEYYPGQTAGGVFHSDECLESQQIEQAYLLVGQVPEDLIEKALWIVGVAPPPVPTCSNPCRPPRRPPNCCELRNYISKFQDLFGDPATGVLTGAEVVRLIRMAAVAGDAEMQNELGIMYTKGIGVPINYPRAQNWFDRASRQRYAEALYNLAILYKVGVSGVPQDGDKAARLMTEAAIDGFNPARCQLLYLLDADGHDKGDRGGGPRGEPR